jgi:arginine-tRNA-protein transferase
MSLPDELSRHKIQFYVTTSYACVYLDGLTSQSLVAAPHHLVNQSHYNDLIKKGFRRSGKFTYKPYCEHCNACIPIRINVKNFKPSKSAKRVLKKHQHLKASVLPLSFHENHFRLYLVYQKTRHEKFKTTDDEISQYNEFLLQSNIDSRLIQFEDQGNLKIVSFVDIIDDGISAVYTFFDTYDKSSSYGTYSILWLINWCIEKKLEYIYLGYWIQESKKMNYKTHFKPFELFINNEWRSFNNEHDTIRLLNNIK